MTNYTVKQYEFQLAAGRTRDELIAASKTMDDFLLTVEGFEYRSLAELDDGTWLDTCYWSSLEDKDELIMQQPFMAEFMACINEASVTCKKAAVATQSYQHAS